MKIIFLNTEGNPLKYEIYNKKITKSYLNMLNLMVVSKFHSMKFLKISLATLIVDFNTFI